jgi:hypothetical protein
MASLSVYSPKPRNDGLAPPPSRDALGLVDGPSRAPRRVVPPMPTVTVAGDRVRRIWLEFQGGILALVGGAGLSLVLYGWIFGNACFIALALSHGFTLRSLSGSLLLPATLWAGGIADVAVLVTFVVVTLKERAARRRGE